MNANGRRQRQAKNRYSHLTPRQRPNYRIRDAAASRRHLDKVIAGERRREQGKSKRK